MTKADSRLSQDPERKRPFDKLRVVLSNVEGRRQCVGVGRLRTASASLAEARLERARAEAGPHAD